jgi:hypothetical protein
MPADIRGVNSLFECIFISKGGRVRERYINKMRKKAVGTPESRIFCRIDMGFILSVPKT